MTAIFSPNAQEAVKPAPVFRLESNYLHRYILLILFFQLPLLATAQTRDVIPIIECIKYVGNNKFLATFGYDNPNKKPISVTEDNSYLVYEGSKPSGKPVSAFKTGRQSNVFTIEFEGRKVVWAIRLPNNNTVYVEANVNASPCQSSSNILPYYTPPAEGKTNTKSGPEIGYYAGKESDGTSDEIFQVDGSYVLLELYANTSAELLLAEIQANGIGIKDDYIINPLLNPRLLTVKILGTDLFKLESLVNMIFAQPVFTAINQVGATTSQGDVAQRSALARLGFGVNGAGVKVGVLSDSYNSKKTTSSDPAAIDVARGDLPATVEVLRDLAPGKGTDEGRAMLQTIWDVAPGTELAFRSAFFGATDFAQGILDLQAADCNIIVDDITYITEPFLQDGIVAQAVNKVVLNEPDPSKKVAYFSAAGNYGNNGRRSYYNIFKSSTAPAGVSGFAHDFGSGDKLQKIALAPGTYTIVMQWDDHFYSLGQGSGSQTDLDIYLADDAGRILYGFNRNNIGKDPVEVLPFIVTGDGAVSNFMIINATNANPVALKYMIFRGDVAITEFATNSSTLVGQANAEGAMAVGAVLYSNTPAFGVNPPTIASFSSKGGTPILRRRDGTAQNITRNKPDITAPNGGNTSVDLAGANIDGDAFYNFFGTSAAAPHAAGVAALLMEAQKNNHGSTLSPLALKNKLITTALNMGPTGFDFETGYGFIRAADLRTVLWHPGLLW